MFCWCTVWVTGPGVTRIISLSTMPDFYAVLGIDKTATDREVKKAFRKLALKHHPDKGGNPERFKEIGEAFACLSDPAKRREYDRFGKLPQGGRGRSGGGGGGGFSPADADDLFKAFFGGHDPFASFATNGAGVPVAGQSFSFGSMRGGSVRMGRMPGGFTFVSSTGGGPGMSFGANPFVQMAQQMEQQQQRQRAKARSRGKRDPEPLSRSEQQAAAARQSDSAGEARFRFRHAQGEGGSVIVPLLKLCGILCCPPSSQCILFLFICCYWFGMFSSLGRADPGDIVWE